MSATMNAIEYDGQGDSGVIRMVRRPIPEPSVGEVLVKVHAAGVNRPDILQRAGNYPPPPGASAIPGLEIAGEVVANGPCSENLKVGARVMALVSGGGYAEYCVAPVPQTLPVPERLSAVEAAAVPETFFTVWTNVFQRCRLKGGETFLVHGGASGIGTTAIQLGDARVHGCSRPPAAIPDAAPARRSVRSARSTTARKTSRTSQGVSPANAVWT